jgi:hypothetical protein
VKEGAYGLEYQRTGTVVETAIDIEDAHKENKKTVPFENEQESSSWQDYFTT